MSEAWLDEEMWAGEHVIDPAFGVAAGTAQLVVNVLQATTNGGIWLEA